MSTSTGVSLCMIVKNEEEWISSCINSVRRLVGEIIVVDTGSSDRTREISRQSGARVFDYPWDGDFASARNYSLSQAVYDWILVLDADEMLDPVGPEEFAALLSSPGVEGYFINIRSYVADGRKVTEDQAVRLFKNRPEYRFRGPIHEQVATSIKSHNRGGGLAFSGLVIHHFGYLDREVAVKNKRRRNVALLKKAIEECPGDPFLLYSLAVEHYQGGETAEGVTLLERALARLSGGEGYFRDVLVALGGGLLKRGEGGRLEAFLEKALTMLPGDPDLHLIRGVLRLRGGTPGAAAEDLRVALEGSGLSPPACIHSLLGDALALSGRGLEAQISYLSALKLDPRSLYPLAQIIGLKQQGPGGADWLEIAGFAAPPVKKALGDELVKMGETPLALVLYLLIALEAACGEGGHPGEACRKFRLEVERYRPEGEFPGRYLPAAAAEMELYARAEELGLGCRFFFPSRKLQDLVRSTLDLVARVFAPPWRTAPNCQVMKGLCPE